LKRCQAYWGLCYVKQNDKVNLAFWDDEQEKWWFSIVDIVAVLTEQPDYTKARKYWRVLKVRLKKEGSQLATNCSQLKLTAADGKKYLTDVAGGCSKFCVS
jgi:hypothetical protein